MYKNIAIKNNDNSKNYKLKDLKKLIDILKLHFIKQVVSALILVCL